MMNKTMHKRQVKFRHAVGVGCKLVQLSAAFDTVNHSLLLSRLENSFNITGTVLGSV